MRAIWNGSLSFGLINIPIRVYPASEDHAMEFHMLHNKDLSPIRFARICKEDGEEIEFKDIVKGYEYEKGEFVVIEEKDFKQANAKKTSSIEIQQFTELSTIDPIYYEKPYYLEPDKKAGKAYVLLQEALTKSKKVAVVNFVFRNREHIGVVMATKEGLLLIQMRYYAEIRSTKDLMMPKEKVNQTELKMAINLIDQSTTPFKPEAYHDTYSEELMEVIEQKLKGKKTKRKTTKAKPASKTTDLMGLLQASLKKTLEETASEKGRSRRVVPSEKKKLRRKHL